MMLVGFLLTLFLTDGASAQFKCTYQDVLNYLNLSMNNELFTMTRPVKNHTQALNVRLGMALYAILDVKELEQKFVPYVWIFMFWQNDYISWTPDQFCGISHITVPTEVLWKPDITIEEMIEKDRAPPSPYLIIVNSGLVILKNDQVLVSTCRMHIYKFPFDMQKCTLSFKSVVHSDKELQLILNANSSMVTEYSREVMLTQYEWVFVNMTVTNQTVNKYGLDQDVIIYTIRMERRSMLYVINFLLPVLFFLCLDLASFLISDTSGEKLSFKITVLLAVTVMQLLLNDILPASSNRIPLIALYCIGIFGLMMLSLLETIVVKYLIEKDSDSQDKEATGDQSLKVKKLCQCLCDIPDETPSDLLSVDRKITISQSTEEYHTLEKVSTELRDIEKILSLILNGNKEEGKPGYWRRRAKTINKVFFMFYVLAAAVFLIVMFFLWTV